VPNTNAFANRFRLPYNFLLEIRREIPVSPFDEVDVEGRRISPYKISDRFVGAASSASSIGIVLKERDPDTLFESNDDVVPHLNLISEYGRSLAAPLVLFAMPERNNQRNLRRLSSSLQCAERAGGRTETRLR
jgi:hypothetical protein